MVEALEEIGLRGLWKVYCPVRGDATASRVRPARVWNTISISRFQSLGTSPQTDRMLSNGRHALPSSSASDIDRGRPQDCCARSYSLRAPAGGSLASCHVPRL